LFRNRGARPGEGTIKGRDNTLLGIVPGGEAVQILKQPRNGAPSKEKRKMGRETAKLGVTWEAKLIEKRWPRIASSYSEKKRKKGGIDKTASTTRVIDRRAIKNVSEGGKL